MATMHVTVDGAVVMDGDMGQWTTEPPKLLADQLAPSSRPAPWMQALMLIMAAAGAGGCTPQAGWTLSVDYAGDETRVQVQTRPAH